MPGLTPIQRMTGAEDSPAFPGRMTSALVLDFHLVQKGEDLEIQIIFQISVSAWLPTLIWAPSTECPTKARREFGLHLGRGQCEFMPFPYYYSVSWRFPLNKGVAVSSSEPVWLL